jgi:hypothetical protein
MYPGHLANEELASLNITARHILGTRIEIYDL